jgi:excisionase family DNA binding protein
VIASGAEPAGRGYVPISKLARELGVSKRTLVRWCAAGKIPTARQIGRKWYVRRGAEVKGGPR